MAAVSKNSKNIKILKSPFSQERLGILAEILYEVLIGP